MPLYSGLASKMMLIRIEWAAAWQQYYRCGWTVSLADRRPYFTYVGGHKAKQNAADEYCNHAADRPKRKIRIDVIHELFHPYHRL
jgi:hypothetical protein